MRVSVIIPAWNLWNLTAACLRSLAEHSRGEDLEVLVVDNGSDDATVQELEPLGRSLWGTAFQALRQSENIGFARACNAGARAASGDLLYFLNNDTTCTAGWLPPLRACFEQAATGAAGPLLLYPDGTVQHCGIAFSPFRRMSHIYEYFPAAHPVLGHQRPLQAITGAALMLRAELFRQCGGFHEGYVNGFEDMDLCFSLRSKGYKLAVAAQSVVYHHTSQTPGRFKHDTENGRLFAQRWGQEIRPDLHIMARLDGYDMCISPSLGAWPVLAAAQAASLRRAVATEEEHGAGPEALAALCGEALQQEPLWEEGWLLRMGFLQAAGQWQEAAAAGVTALGFFPSVAVHKALLPLLRHCGRKDELAQVMASLQNELEAQAAMSSRKPMVLAARREADQQGDKVLSALLARWLEACGGTPA